LLVPLDSKPNEMSYRGDLSSEDQIRKYAKTVIEEYIMNNRPEKSVDCGCKNSAPFLV